MTYKKIAWWALVGLILILASNLLLTLTYYNPRLAVAAYRLVVRSPAAGLFLEDATTALNHDKLYPTVSISTLQHDLFWKSRAQVIGTVADVEKIVDGDWHVNLTDDANRTLVTEISPEFPLVPPAVGQKIMIWGITRFDLEHRWWELHPVFGWKGI